MGRWQLIVEGAALVALGAVVLAVAIPRARRHTLKKRRRKAIYFGSQWGKSQKLADAVEAAWEASESASSLALCTVEDLPALDVACIVIGTQEGGAPPEDSKAFCQLLEDASWDFRFGNAYLQNTEVWVLGIGDPNYNEHFCVPAKSAAAALQRLGAMVHLALLGPADELDATALDKARLFDTKEEEVPAEIEEGDESDLEDAAQCGKEMLSKRQRKALTKEGYKIVGSHSAVKLCRWTKHHIRGRGGCYKHTFYGIQSFGCMESTPSLACANKCVFCWRHHTNPVAKEWKWKVDPPEMLVEEWLKNHRNLIKQLKGVPGVTPERFNEAMKVRHCALSLVGEPIMYPHINELLGMLHARHISTFLVTNAQFPKEMAAITHCTQLYCSVDAATKDELKKVDRPLHDDFWERFKDSLEVLSRQPYRTVLRLTLVKKYNMSEAANFASVIKTAQPDFVEIKAVTYCGDNGKDSITMKDIPWHEEVKSYAKAILGCEGMDDFDLACDHKHSCCILIAHKKYRIDGVWHTWIDYPKFFELQAKGEPFDGLAYSLPTPSWAVAGAVEEGFDPEETRHFRKKA
eukprot:GEMP01038189.1.p1 GENE.GEMP01038189.1~~GEMP01038189.1.p1  ORF type:complete len:576 (+),score=133.18 GEMP01038189.1:218-1945(+)